MKNPTTRIFGLDALRAMAITLVIISHATYLLFPNTEHTLLILVRAMGAVGVDLFFVLSGFLIGGILLKKIQNNQTHFSDLHLFFKRRWLRTLPNYLVVLLLNLALVFILKKEIPENTASYFLFSQNFATPHPHFFTEAWSLSIEEYAYLLLPILLYMLIAFFPKKEKSKIFFSTTVAVILALFILKLQYYNQGEITTYKQWSATFRKVVIYRLDAIYVGFLLVYIYQKYKAILNNYKWLLAGIGIFSFLGLHAYIYITNATPQTHLGFYVCVYSQVIQISIASIFPLIITINGSGVFQKIIQYISVRSYAIYLINYSLILLTMQSFFNLETFSTLQKIACLLLYLLSTIFFSEILYRTIEQAFLRYRKTRFPRNINID